MGGQAQPAQRHCFKVAFWMDKLEVNQLQFRLMGGFKTHFSGFAGDQLPVEKVTSQAENYCQQRGGLLPVKPHGNMRRAAQAA